MLHELMVFSVCFFENFVFATLMPAILPYALSDDDLRFFGDFLERAKQFKSWTPAMIAMMICGIQPVANCTSIPDQAASLIQSSRAATRDEIDNARFVLKDWLMYKFSDGEGDLPSPSVVEKILRTPVSCFDFCIDCEDAGLRSRAPLLMELISVNSVDEAYLTAAARSATELHELKKRSQSNQEQLLIFGDAKQAATSEDVSIRQLTVEQWLEARPSRLISMSTPGRPNTIEELVIAAENAVGAVLINRAKIIYNKCLELAKADPRCCANMTLRVDGKNLYFTLDDSEVERMYQRRLITQRVRAQIKQALRSSLDNPTG